MDPADSDSEHAHSDHEDSDYEDEEDSDTENEDSEEIKKFANMINSTQKPVQFEGLVGIRMLLSQVDSPPIQEVIDSGILPKILEMMVWENESHFQVESAWCILNISAGETKFTDCLLELGSLDIVINLLDSPLSDIVEQAVWTISNITATSIKHRNFCLQKDCLSKLLQTLEKFPTSDTIIENGLNAIAELCKGKPYPPREIILPALPLLYKHISDVFSQEALISALWGLSYIGDENTQEVIDQGCVPFLIQHFCEGSQDVLAATFRAVAHLLAGDEKQANEVLNYPEFLPKLFEMTTHKRMVFRKEAFWAISNITAGTSEQIGMIIENDNYIQRLKTSVAQEQPEAAKEAAWALTNMFSAATDEQIYHVIYKHGLLKSLVFIFTDFEDDLKQNAFEAILNIFKTKAFETEKDSWVEEIKGAGIIGRIRDLANQKNCDSNANLIQKYFSAENPEEAEEKIINKNQENSDKED